MEPPRLGAELLQTRPGRERLALRELDGVVATVRNWLVLISRLRDVDDGRDILQLVRGIGRWRCRSYLSPLVGPVGACAMAL